MKVKNKLYTDNERTNFMEEEERTRVQVQSNNISIVGTSSSSGNKFISKKHIVNPS